MVVDEEPGGIKHPGMTYLDTVQLLEYRRQMFKRPYRDRGHNPHVNLAAQRLDQLPVERRFSRFNRVRVQMAGKQETHTSQASMEVGIVKRGK